MNTTAESTTPRPRSKPPISSEAAGCAHFSLSDIRFEKDHLWRPRYGSLFDYEKVALGRGCRIEPSFQISRGAVDRVEITLEIAHPGVTFRRWGESSDKVVAYSVADPKPDGRQVAWPAGLADLRLDGSLQRCHLVWDSSQAQAGATTLRIACDGGRAHGRHGRELAAVRGGLWLTFVDSFLRPLMPPRPMPQDQGATPPFVVECEHVEGEERLRYDVIRSQVYRHIPAGIEPDLAFRVVRGVPFPFGIALGAGLAGVAFQPAGREESDQLQVYPLQPRQRRELALAPTQCQARGERCCLRWLGQGGRAHGDVGVISRFELGLEVRERRPLSPSLGELRREDGRTLRLAVDPTIIEPPPCDPLTQTCLPR